MMTLMVCCTQQEEYQHSCTPLDLPTETMEGTCAQKYSAHSISSLKLLVLSLSVQVPCFDRPNTLLWPCDSGIFVQEEAATMDLKDGAEGNPRSHRESFRRALLTFQPQKTMPENTILCVDLDKKHPNFDRTPHTHADEGCKRRLGSFLSGGTLNFREKGSVGVLSVQVPCFDRPNTLRIPCFDRANTLSACYDLCMRSCSSIGDAAQTDALRGTNDEIERNVMKAPLRLISLCSGIGGIDYAWSYLLGQEIAGQVENDPYCQAVLYKRWPDVVKRSDIREIQEEDPFGPIDLVAGGIPCQPFSLSGQRRGTEDDRHLWPFALTFIKRKQPTWVLIENVTGFISLALDLVQTDLEGAGYASQAYVLPACAVGAPHIRERVFIVAHTTGRGWTTRGTQFEGQQGPLFANGSRASHMAHSGCSGCREWTNQSQPQPECIGTSNISNDGAQGNMADSNRQRQQECHASTRGNLSGLVTRCAHSDEYITPGQPQPRMGRGSYGPTSGMDSHRWPSPPNQAQEEWEPPRTIAHKLKHRASRLKALGNMVVPQQVYPILKAMIESEQTWSEEMSA